MWLQGGLELLFNQLTRPRLRAVLDECYKDTSYLLDEDGFAEAEEMDIIRKRFQRGWDGLVDGYKVSCSTRHELCFGVSSRLTSNQDVLTDHNYQILFNLTVETLVRPWEKMVMGMRFTEVGFPAVR